MRTPENNGLIVVTGAGRGIGREIASALAYVGYDLAICDIAADIPGLSYPLSTSADLATTEQDCRAAGVDVTAAGIDVRDESSLKQFIGSLDSTRIVGAVAVAGVMGPDGHAWELSAADLQLDLDVNLHGVANLARAVIPPLLDHQVGRGRFVAVVSSAATSGLPRLSSYVAAKHATLGYIRSLAADLGPYGITANAVLPGSTDTELLRRTARAYGLSSPSDFSVHQRLGRLIDPAEIAAAVVFLCSPASSAITGSAMAVDGGFAG